MDLNVKYTPMMMQYIDVKKNYMDCIVFYRLGDFYEMFFDDAKIASKELDLVLTGRNAGIEEKIPMCGVPFHAASSYIQRLSNKGYKVAIVEQLEAADQGKTLVKRDVVKIVTPGTIMEELSENSTVLLAVISDFGNNLVVSKFEMSTGESTTQIIERDLFSLQKSIMSSNVKEVVVTSNFDKKLYKYINETLGITISKHDEILNIDEYMKLCIYDDERIIENFILLVNYLIKTQKREISHLKPLVLVNENDYMKMDYNTRTNLELINPLRNNAKTTTLYSFLDKCRSAMGSRRLRSWIEYPLINEININKRLDAIEYLNDNIFNQDELKELLNEIYDLDRISARIAYGSASPRDIQRLVSTLKVIPDIINIWSNTNIYNEFNNLDNLNDLYFMLDGIIVDEPPLYAKEGNIFNYGFNNILDDYKNISSNAKQYILDIENKERERTGIKTLKIGYNRIFGYFIEVTKSNIGLIKEEYGYVRKQTLSNAERYITEELKEKEDIILNAQEKAIRLEVELFNELINKLKDNLERISKVSNEIANMDALYALSVISKEHGYIRPRFTNNRTVNIVESRHPILEKIMKSTQYVSNDLVMDEDLNINIITGPNMGGKSTYMRQVAICVIMAQIGCYVPAKIAEFKIFDQIFTRIGASDDIMSGQSTFMVEMIEANNALRYATADSLILFDEIGRGTSTFDGMALAQAILEYIDINVKAKTLFSTHYHELTDLANNKSIKNIHVEVYESNNEVTFMYKMLEGKADKSYGINVARLANLPESLLTRSTLLLKQYETSNTTISSNTEVVYIEKENKQLESIKQLLSNIDIDNLRGGDALNILDDIIKKIN